MSKYFSQKQCSYLGQFVKTFFVSFQASTVNLLCKATISVHDDGDVFGHRSSSEDTVTKLTNVACFPIFLKPRHRCIAKVFLPDQTAELHFFPDFLERTGTAHAQCALYLCMMSWQRRSPCLPPCHAFTVPSWAKMEGDLSTFRWP